MHHNFITPPDFVVSVLIVDAGGDELSAIAEQCRMSDITYNIYLYHYEMADIPWLKQAMSKSDIVLLAQGSAVPVIWNFKFGPDEKFKTPADYFKDVQKN